MSVAVTCSKVYPGCAYVLSAGTESTNVNAWLDHVDQMHNQQHPGPQNAKRKDALTFV